MREFQEDCDYNQLILDKAKALGCDPLWMDGMIGEAWHCDCRDNAHGYDSQCSVITMGSLIRYQAKFER